MKKATANQNIVSNNSNGMEVKSIWLCASLLSLSLLPFSVQAGLKADCRGSPHCTDKTINANTPDYVDIVTPPPHFHGNTNLTISATGAFKNIKGTVTFRDNTHVTITAQKGIEGGLYSLQEVKDKYAPNAKVIVDVNATQGILDAKLISQKTNPSIVNANENQAISNVDLTFNQGTTLNINRENGVYNSKSLILDGGVMNLNASNAFTDQTVSAAKKNTASLKGNSTLNITEKQGMSGGQINLINDVDSATKKVTRLNNSTVNIIRNGSISGGVLLLGGTTTLNASVADAIINPGGDKYKQIFSDNARMNISAERAVKGGNQIFNGNSILNVQAKDGLVDGRQIMADNSILNVDAESAIIGGTISIKNNAELNVKAKNGINGGNLDVADNGQINVIDKGSINNGAIVFKGAAKLNANVINAITGSTDGVNKQIFNDSSMLNLRASRALNGGSQTFKDNSILNVQAKDGIVNGRQIMADNSILNVVAESAIIGGTISVKDNAKIIVKAKNGINGGKLDLANNGQIDIIDQGSIDNSSISFKNNSQLNINVADAITGSTDGTNKQVFNNASVMDLNASKALNGGSQIFKDSSVVNIRKEQGIVGGYQIFDDNSQLNALAISSIADGTMKFQGKAILNAVTDQTVIGGIQNFTADSIVNATGGNTFSGGTQNFQDHSIVNADSKGVITGSSKQQFSGNAHLIVNVTDAINGGSSAIFKDNAIVDVNTTAGVSGGMLLFDGDSVLNINAEQGVAGSMPRFKGNSHINLNSRNSFSIPAIILEGDARLILNADDAINSNNTITFNNTYDTINGSALDVNGHSLRVGKITENSGQKAQIINSSDQDAILTSGLYSYGLRAGQSYNYNKLSRNGIMRVDAVVSSAQADIMRQANIAMLPQFSDLLVPQSANIMQTGQTVWLQTDISQQGGKGAGVTHAEWRGRVEKILLGSDLFPASEDSANKFGVYIGYLSGNADINGRQLFSATGKVGQSRFSLYGGGVYWRYLTTQGWYTNTVVQMNHYSSHVSAGNSVHKPDVDGNSLLASFEMAYPLALSESLTLLPRLQFAYQKLTMSNYRFDDLRVHSTPDSQLSASVGARIYWENMTISGIHWSPYFDVNVQDNFAARDRNQMQVLSINYGESLLSSYAQTAITLQGGVAVKLNDVTSYYVKLGYRNALANSANAWQGAMGISINW